MPRTNSTIKIVNSKVVFSQEIIDYFENLRNEETSEWIDKYFDVLNDENNLTSEKYNIHHIRPCHTFKDKEHKTRKQTKPLADEFNGNLIKLSVYNHLFAHHCLWKIFNNYDSKMAFQRMCGLKTYIDNLTEDELKEIATLKEECAKKNQTKEERKKLNKQWYENNKEKISEKTKEYYKNNKEEILKQVKDRYKTHKEEILKQKKEYRELNKEKKIERGKEYRENNKEEISKQKKIYYENNKDDILEKSKERYKNNKEEILEKNRERYENNKEKYSKTMKEWREKHKEELSEKSKEYRENNKDKISKRMKEYYENNKEELLVKEKEYREIHKEELSKKSKDKNSRLCYDPIEKDNCSYGALKRRKSKNKEKYKDVILKDCIIQPQPQS